MEIRFVYTYLLRKNIRKDVMNITLLQKSLVFTLFLALQCIVTQAQDSRAKSFDKNWRFQKDTLTGAENPSFDDSKWRVFKPSS